MWEGVCDYPSACNFDTLLPPSYPLQSGLQLLLPRVPSWEVLPDVFTQFFLLSLQYNYCLFCYLGGIGTLMAWGLLPPLPQAMVPYGSLKAWPASLVHLPACIYRGLGLCVK